MPSGESQREAGRGPEKGRPPGPPPGPRPNILSAAMFAGGKVVKNQPYSATAITESMQELRDGTRIAEKNSVQIYRDSEGRTRRESQQTNANESELKTTHFIFINDVVANTQYTLDTNKNTAFRNARPPAPPPFARSMQAPDAANTRTEALGKKMLEGIEVEGTRFVLTIPIGERGNDRPIEIVTERWFSPELQTLIFSRHDDPRSSATTFRLTNINRAEPARSLFEIPSNYTVQDFGDFSGGHERRPPPPDKMSERDKPRKEKRRNEPE